MGIVYNIFNKDTSYILMRKAKNGNKKAEASSKEEERKTEVSDNINKCKALKICHINSFHKLV